jgi:hypothetical protein
MAIFIRVPPIVRQNVVAVTVKKRLGRLGRYSNGSLADCERFPESVPPGAKPREANEFVGHPD